MDLEDVGEIIAERELEIEDNRIVRVVIGKPQPYPGGHNYYCPFQIKGIGKEKVISAGGVDSVQALLMALQGISANLYTSAQARNGTLTWLGRRNYGLPVTPAIKDFVPEDGE